ncbi:dehydrogenase [Niastella vici]|uniref:Dehydrogenase n=1 Tax=Niastella vici TaxID=1703345 RepID=A0A1V9G9P7_9BACT|nr:dehydrogenase E1 component subunit alpha/beta [Niastella vici]OQP67186.1 dehydrogenase [Niastella vici]
MHFDSKDLTHDQLVHFYKSLLLPRMIEEKMLVLLRQGKISKWFSGIGQEAISVGVTLALDEDEWILPLHRNLGVFTTRHMPLHKLLMQWQGNQSGYSKGRERSFHFGHAQHHICGMISHLGPQLGIADGIALAHKLKKENKVVVVFTGEGGTSEGDFHEAVNVAAVWDLPVIFVIENNGYALSTPVHEQYRCEALVEKARGYGIDGVKIDGNNILGVYDTIKGVKQYCAEFQRPYLIECATFRMRGHEEASGTKYVPPYLFEVWEMKDPIKKFEEFLLSKHVLTREVMDAIHQDLKEYIDVECSIGFNAKPMVVDSHKELQEVYAVKKNEGAGVQSSNAYGAEPAPNTIYIQHPADTVSHHRFIDAIKDGLKQSMHRHADLILMGQDIAEYGGVFKITEGFVDEFGKERVRNTPLCESAIIGASLGLSIKGYRSMIEMQFADFVTMGFTQIVNNLAKMHYRWGQPANVVIRMPCGAGVGAGPFHSQSNEAWFVHVPGLKVVYPSTPADAKGLLIAAINDPNPVLFFEHKMLYRSVSGDVPDAYYETEIGKARHVRSGEDMTIITYGLGVIWAEEYASEHPEISIDILDLRTLLPLDYEAIREAVGRTGRVLVLHEDTLTGGIGGEVAAWIGEHCFQSLDAPVLRCASLDTPVPFNLELENNFLAKARLGETVERLINY